MQKHSTKPYHQFLKEDFLESEEKIKYSDPIYCYDLADLAKKECIKNFPSEKIIEYYQKAISSWEREKDMTSEKNMRVLKGIQQELEDYQSTQNRTRSNLIEKLINY